MKLSSRKAQRGNAVVEFALSISLLAVLFTGVYQYGYTMHVYNSLETSVANAARAGMRTSMYSDNKAAFRRALQNLAVFGNTAGTGNPIVTGLTTAHVNVVLSPDSATLAPQTVTVAVNGYTVDGMFRCYNLTDKPRVTMPYAANYMVPEAGGGGGGGK